MRRIVISASAATLAVAALASCGDDRREERLIAAGTNPSLEALMKVADADVGRGKFRQCAACHSVTKGAFDKGGPNLFGVFRTRFATNRPRFGYTAALSQAGGVWDERTLNAWIENPTKMVPGTTMQVPGVADPLTRADIIAYLRAQVP